MCLFGQAAKSGVGEAMRIEILRANQLVEISWNLGDINGLPFVYFAREIVISIVQDGARQAGHAVIVLVRERSEDEKRGEIVGVNFSRKIEPATESDKHVDRRTRGRRGCDANAGTLELLEEGHGHKTALRLLGRLGATNRSREDD